jgi:mannose-1-phosphate guanylyltransferase
MSAESAIVLVGGFGTRLRPLTLSVPKQLIPIAGRPALYHVFDLLPPKVPYIALACGYKADVIERYIKDHPYPIPVKLVKEELPLGTGGAMKNAASLATENFILLNGDVVSGIDIEAMVKEHHRQGGLGTMSLYPVEDTTPYGVADMDDKKRIIKFVEKPKPEDAPSHWINAGASVWNKQILDPIPTGRQVSFEQEILPGLLDKGVYGYTFNSWWEDAGTPDRVLNAQKLLFDHPHRRKTPLVSSPAKNVLQPVAVGEGCRLDGKLVGSYVTLGNKVLLEENSTVVDSILMDGAVVGHGAKVIHSIIGPGYFVPPHTDVKNACLALTPYATAIESLSD